MKKNRFIYIFLILIFLLPASIGAIDIGFVVNEYFAYDNFKGFEFRAGLVPRLSFIFGDHSSFFMSAGFDVGKKDGEYYYSEYLELLRTEFSTLYGPWGIRAGRINYSDPLSFSASGLFNGIHLTHTSSQGRTGIGIWHAGQQQILSAVEWEHPAVLDLFSLKAAYTGNMTNPFSSPNDAFNSHFFTLKAGLPISSFIIELGAVHEWTETLIQNDAPVYSQALAAELGFYWTVPTPFTSRLSFIVRTAIGPFVPVSPKTYGEIFTANLSGITIVTADYTARFLRQLGAGVTLSYFIRNDLQTPNSFTISAPGNNGYLLGGEITSRVVWSPFSDLQFILGGGAFFPAMGNNWPNVNPLWRINLTLIFAIL